MESIHKIPVHEAFAVKDGCPVCRLFERYERNAVNILMTEGVMEPETRVATNREGFCARHIEMITARKDSLSLALLMSSRIKETEKLFSECKTPFGDGYSAKKLQKAAVEVTDGCYICGGLTKLMRECAEAISMIYGEEEEFRKQFREQEFFCMTHTRLLLENIRLPSKTVNVYAGDIKRVNSAYAEKLISELNAYSESFDYRNRGADVSVTKGAGERAGKFLK